MPKVVFFDAAGTLIHLPQPVGEHYRTVARRFGVDLPATAWQQAFRRAWAAAPARPATPGPRPDDDRGWWRALVDQILDETLPGTLQSGFPRDDYFAALYAHFAQDGIWALYPEAPAVLAALQADGHRLAVISNFDQRLPAIFTGLGGSRYFDCVVVSSQAGAEKPDPQIFHHALAAMHVAPADAVHVGDDLARDGGAEAVGLAFFHMDRPDVTLRDVPAWLATRRLATPALGG